MLHINESHIKLLKGYYNATRAEAVEVLKAMDSVEEESHPTQTGLRSIKKPRLPHAIKISTFLKTLAQNPSDIIF